MYELNKNETKLPAVTEKTGLIKIKKYDPGLLVREKEKLTALVREESKKTRRKMMEKRKEMSIDEIIDKSGVILSNLNLQNEVQSYPPTKWDGKTSQTIRISGERMPWISKQLDYHGINEYIKFEPVMQMFSRKEHKIEKKFFGLIKKQVDEEVGYSRNLTHRELVKDGSVEPAVAITYAAADSLNDHGDYKVPDGRGGNFLMAKLIVPKSLADEVIKLMRKDPKIIRKIVEKSLIKKGIVTKDQWEKGDKNLSPMRPPYERWQQNKTENKIYIEQKGENQFEFKLSSVKSIDQPVLASNENEENFVSETSKNTKPPRETAESKDHVDSGAEDKVKTPKPPVVESKKTPPESDDIGLVRKDVRGRIETMGFEKKEKESEIKIPRGWTYLKHGTNFVNWAGTDIFSADEIEMKKELSVITKEDWEKDAGLVGNYDTTKNYSRASKPKEMSEEQFAQLNKPFEIRVLFYKNHIHLKTDPEYAAKLDEKTKDVILHYYLRNLQHGRHPVVPRKEKLIKLDHKVENGVDVFYFVPQDVLEDYEKEAGVKVNRRLNTNS